MLLKDFSKIFFTILVLHLVVIDVGESEMLLFFTKPLILLSLIAFYWGHTENRQSFETKFLLGLVFSLLGDVLLMFSEKAELFFMLGLGAFLIAQVFYSWAFIKENIGTKGLLQRQPWLALVLLGYGVWFVLLLKDNLGSLLVPVIVYAFMLTTMANAALNRFGKVPVKSFVLVFVGALFFVASDSVLAYTKFVDVFPYSRIVVMATYGLAQYFLVWGMLQKRLDS